ACTVDAGRAQIRAIWSPRGPPGGSRPRPGCWLRPWPGPRPGAPLPGSLPVGAARFRGSSAHLRMRGGETAESKVPKVPSRRSHPATVRGPGPLERPRGMGPSALVAPATGGRLGSTEAIMRVLVIGAGGVGSAVAKTAAKWDLFEHVGVADYDVRRAQQAVAGHGDRFAAYQLDAGDERAVEGLIRSERADAVLNALDPRFVMPVFRAAFAAGVTYLDMAMSLSHPHPTEPYRLPGVKLGDEQFAMEDQWKERGLLALCGIGVEPGLSDVFARYAADNLFSSIDEIGVRDGANLVVKGY